jgi:hypothetical protein
MQALDVWRAANMLLMRYQGEAVFITGLTRDHAPATFKSRNCQCLFRRLRM